MIAWIAWAAALSLAVTVAALAAEAALRLFARPARWVWAAALALSLAAPVVLPRQPAVVGTGGMEMGTMGGPPSPASSSFASVHAAAPVPRSPWTEMRGRVDGALPYLWLAASLAMAVGLAGASLALGRRRRAWRPAVVGGAEVLISERMGPAVVGFIDTDIVLPRWTLGWAAPLQRLIVRHEREHIDAGDPLLLLFALLAVAAAPWNPALWWQLRRLQLAMEVDCDARILRREPDVGAYGRLLLEVGRLAGGARIPVAAFSEPRSFLERRIRIMTASTPRNRAARIAALTAVLVGAGTLAAVLPVPVRPALAFAQVVQLDTTPTAAERRAREEAAADRERSRDTQETERRARTEAQRVEERARDGERRASQRDGERAGRAEETVRGADARARREAEVDARRSRSDVVEHQRVETAERQARAADVLAQRQAELSAAQAGLRARSDQQGQAAERQAYAADVLAQRRAELSVARSGTRVREDHQHVERAERQASAADILARRQAGLTMAQQERQARVADVVAQRRAELDQARARQEPMPRENERSANRARSEEARVERERTVEEVRAREATAGVGGELRARVLEALARYQPRYAREGTAADEFVYFLEDRAGNVRGAGVARIAAARGTTTDALERIVRGQHPNLRVRDSYQWVGLRVREGGPRVNVAWVVVEN